MLAIDGGAPIRTTAWPAWPVFAEDEVAAATAVLRSGKVNYWTGTTGRDFERAFAEYVGVPHAVAVANGTVALELALRGLGVGPGDEVVVPSCTFVATASAVAAVGARPVFCDVCPDRASMTVETLDAVTTARTRAVIVVHLGGWPADLMPISELCSARGYGLVEDCAQAHGARIGDAPVGSVGDVAAFSFCQDKIMTTAGEGGMIVTRDRDLWSRIWSAKDHGKSWSAVYEEQHAPGFRWLHRTLGTNARMTEIQAAVGCVQLQKLDRWVLARQQAAARIRRALDGVPIFSTPRPADNEDAAASYYRLYSRVRPDRLAAGWTRDRVMLALEAEGIPCQVGSCAEIYREAAFPASWRPPQRLASAAQLTETALAFTVHPTLNGADLDDVDAAVARVGAAATR